MSYFEDYDRSWKKTQSELSGIEMLKDPESEIYKSVWEDIDSAETARIDEMMDVIKAHTGYIDGDISGFIQNVVRLSYLDGIKIAERHINDLESAEAEN